MKSVRLEIDRVTYPGSVSRPYFGIDYYEISPLFVNQFVLETLQIFLDGSRNYLK